AQRDRQEVEESVVACQDDQDLQARHRRRRDQPQPPRREDEERRSELHREHEGAREFLEGDRHLVHEPRRPRRKRLGPVVVSQRRQAPPVRVAAQKLDQPRGEHQPEEEPQKKRPGDPGPGEERPEARRLPRREPDRQEPRLEKEQVPLELQELLADDRERQVEKPADEERRRRNETREDQGARERPPRAEKMEKPVARVEPRERREERPPRPAELRADVLEELS